MPHTNNNTPFEIIDWSSHPVVAAALGEGEPLTEEQVRLLAILVDPSLDPYDNDSARFEELVEEWSAFGGFYAEDISSLAFRLQLFHQRLEGDDTWVFQYSQTEGESWYEVGSYLPGTRLHITLGDDGKHLSRCRFELVGLRAALNDAEIIENTWQVVREQMIERGMVTASPPTPPGRYLVRWEIDDASEASSPEQAAARVWRNVFKRTTASSDDACVFSVLDSTIGGVTTVDLAELDLDSLLSITTPERSEDKAGCDPATT